jgi:hypothetical protein
MFLGTFQHGCQVIEQVVRGASVESKPDIDTLQMSTGPLTRAWMRRLQKAINGLVKEYI